MVGGCADMSSSQLTSRYCRTDSIVSLEWGVCLCAELKASSCYRGWKEACQASRAISTKSRQFFSCDARPWRKFAPFWQRHYVNMQHRMLLSKPWWPSLNVQIFPRVLRLVLDDSKQRPTRSLLTKFMG